MTDKASLLAKFGSEAAISEYYRELKRKSMAHPNNQKGSHRGGFSDKEFAKQASLRGVEARRAKRKQVSKKETVDNETQAQS
jgi:hypothetical protein